MKSVVDSTSEYTTLPCCICLAGNKALLKNLHEIVYSAISPVSHTLFGLIKWKQGSPSALLMTLLWMKDVCKNSQHLFAAVSSQRAAPIPHA